MELGKIIEFRKDLYFEGAVQADWFYSKEKATKVAENFVFHGKQYYGVEDQGIGAKKRIDTISFVKELVEKLNDDRSNALSLAIADYGTGKSHLAVTLAQIFSGPQYMADSYKRIIENIASIDSVADVSKSLRSNSFKALHPLNIPSIFFTYLEVNFDKFMLVNLLSPTNISLISSASFGLKLDKSKDSRYHISANI